MRLFSIKAKKEVINVELIIPIDNEKYQEYINRILFFRDNVKDEDNYQEIHHIVPRCMGGNDEYDNLIYLYAQEHYYAHKLLALENPENNSLQCAWLAVSGWKNKNHQNEIKLTPEEYEQARLKVSNIMKNREITEETKRKISENHADISGEKNPMYGKHHTEETKEKLRQKNLGKKLTQEHKDKISKSSKGRIISEETKKKMGENHWDCSGGKHPKANKVVCIETGDVFECAKYAGMWAGLKGNNPGTSIIAQIRNPLTKKYAGHHPITKQSLTWQYYTE